LKSCPFCSYQLTVLDIGGRERLACSNCDFVHWNNPKPVTATVIPLDGGVVLVKRKFEPFVNDWCLPGGFIEAAEHPAESAAREVLEETGLEVRVSRLLEAGAPGRGINVVILFYEAIPTGGQLSAGDDAADVGSFKLNELPGNIAFDMHRQVILRWFESQVPTQGFGSNK
jgi:8-oxo-dGTP diphosphatase